MVNSPISDALLGSPLLPGFFLIIIRRSDLEILSFKHVIAVQASHVIDPVAPHQ